MGISVDELYRQENVGIDKFEQQIEDLKKEIKDLTPTADERLYDCIFCDPEERRRKRAQEEKQIPILEEQLNKCGKKMLRERLTDKGYGIANSRIYPPKELQNRVVEEHMNLCDIYAAKYYYIYHRRIEYKELYQTASLALVHAAKNYVPGKGATFNTYASRCIENEILRTYSKKNKKRITTYEELLIKMNILLIYIDLIGQKKEKNFYKITSPINIALTMSGFEKYSINRKNKELISKEHLTWKIIRKLYGEISKKTEISQMITPEERNLISLEIEYRKIGEDEKISTTLQLIIKTYMQKLANSMIYNRVYKELLRENSFVSEEMVIRKANEFIQKTNKRFKELNNLTADLHKKVGFRRKRFYSSSVITRSEDGKLQSKEFKNFYGGIVLQMDYDIRSDYINAYSTIVDFDADDEYAKDEYYTRVLDKIDCGKEYKWTPQMFYRDKLDQIYTQQRDSYIDLMEIDLIPARDKNYEDEETLKEAIENIGLYGVYDESDVADFINTLDPEIKEIVKEAEELDDIDQLRETLFTIYERLDNLYSETINHEKESRKKFIRTHMQEVDRKAKFRVNYIERKETLKQENNELYKLCVIGNIGLRKWDENTLEEIRNFNRKNSSLSVIISDGEIEEKEYKAKQTLEEQAEGQALIRDYKKCLSELDSIEQQVLNYWFDEEFKHSYSAKEIADELNIESKEVEKIKNKSLQKIRNNPMMQKYQDFID